jgi:manganese oxidase
MSRIYLPEDASRARIREADNARRNRGEIVRAQSQGQVSRRDLLKLGLFTTAGLLAPIGGLNPFVGSAGASIPTGAPRSPLFGVKEFTQAMPRFDLVPRYPSTILNPAPMQEANTAPRAVQPELGGGTGPVEGRPPGTVWGHQKFLEHYPNVCVQMTQQGARTNTSYNPGVPSSLNSGIMPRQSIPVRFHPKFPTQDVNSVWTFNGTVPPKLVQTRYGEPVLFRHWNALPPDVTKNNGFGRHTISTHLHNGHHGAENDGFTGAFFFPGQFYDYHWPIVLAGHTSINQYATDRMASAPDGKGGLNWVPGDWHETMSTHWFHDHMFSFTAQNVYKGNLAMMNIYSGLDRGNEDLDDGVNLRLPSGSAKDWGNLDYDVNLVVMDQAYDQSGQLYFDIFDFDGFLGDVMTVNFAYKPFFEVEARKYRFRILNGSVSRFLKIGLVDRNGNAQPMIQIGNDGNLLPSPVTLMALDQQGTAERYEIVIDFSKYNMGTKLHLVNLAEHADGRGPLRDLSVAEALSGTSPDPGVGRFLEFRVVRKPSKPDTSRVPGTLIPNPDLTSIPVAPRVRNFYFGRDAIQPNSDPIAAFIGPWGIGLDSETNPKLAADFNRIDAAPKYGTREVWNLINNGGGWDHPVHIHFEEGIILARNGGQTPVPAWERGRKDVYRLTPGGTVTISIQFRDFGGMFMEHCHNTVHEDNAMLLRWEIDQYGDTVLTPLPTPLPTPQGVNWESPI